MFAQRLKTAMKEKGMNYIQLADAIYAITKGRSLNTSAKRLQRYTIDTSPTIRTVKLIAGVLGVDAAYLAFGEGIYKNKDNTHEVIMNGLEMEAEFLARDHLLGMLKSKDNPLMKQEALGKDFQKVIDDNIDDLYE